MGATQQFELCVKHARRVLAGMGSLAPDPAEGEGGDDTDLMDSLEGMSAVAEARGGSGGIFKEFAKILKGQKKKATASPKVRRELGLDRLA